MRARETKIAIAANHAHTPTFSARAAMTPKK